MRIRKSVVAYLLLCVICLPVPANAQGKFKSFLDDAGFKNPDIIAWLEIPGASISLPVLQHAQEDTFYSSHGADGKEDPGGALYTQAKYNAADFSDPVTVVYGKSGNAQQSFGLLQEKYSGSYEECRTIYLHLPKETREYRVFAAVPYSSIHILHYYDFHTARRFESFFDSVFSTRVLGLHLSEEDRPHPPNDQVLILSTSARGDRTQRYLVAAKLIQQ